MGTALRPHRIDSRAHARLPICVPIEIRTLDGVQRCHGAFCREIGFGGLRIAAMDTLPPQTPLRVDLTLPSGRRLVVQGRVAWSKQNLRPALFGAPVAHDDDGAFGIVFDQVQNEPLLPIARLFAARDQERARARRLQRFVTRPLGA